MSKNNLEEMSCFFDKRAESYDRHMLDEMSLTEFYDEVERCIAMDNGFAKVLDLGCGTGLELERVFKIHKDAKVTAIDLSEKMLEKLKQKFEDKISNIVVICGSYFEINFGFELYDLVLSTYSLHHFSSDEKLALYKRIYESLKPGGRFINGDHTVKSIDKEQFYIEEYKRMREKQGTEYGFYHFDTPLAIETEICLLEQAGFEKINIHKQWENTTIFECHKVQKSCIAEEQEGLK